MTEYEENFTHCPEDETAVNILEWFIPWMEHSRRLEFSSWYPLNEMIYSDSKTGVQREHYKYITLHNFPR